MVSFMKGSYIKISFRMIVKLPVVYLLFFSLPLYGNDPFKECNFILLFRISDSVLH